MSEARFDSNVIVTSDNNMGSIATVRRAIDHLDKALEMIDMLDHPDLGARLQGIIDSLWEIQPDH